ncbi:hypothetical protein BH10ACT2_BH10ACT2_21100 [soil metagenome]
MHSTWTNSMTQGGLGSFFAPGLSEIRFSAVRKGIRRNVYFLSQVDHANGRKFSLSSQQSLITEVSREDLTIMRLPKTPFIAILAGLSIAGVVGASAATLGGLTSTGVGSDNSVVAACDSDGIAIAYTTSYSATAQAYEVTAVNFTGVSATCNAKAASVSLRNGTTALGTANVTSITVTAGAFSIPLASPVAAASVNGVSLLISG